MVNNTRFVTFSYSHLTSLKAGRHAPGQQLFDPRLMNKAFVYLKLCVLTELWWDSKSEFTSSLILLKIM